MKRTLLAGLVLLGLVGAARAQDDNNYFAGNAEYVVPEHNILFSHAVDYYRRAETGEIWIRIYPPIGGVPYRDTFHTYIYVQFGQPYPDGRRACTGQIQVSIGNDGWQFAGRLTPARPSALQANAQCCLLGNQDIYEEGYVSTYYEALTNPPGGALTQRLVIYFRPKN